MKEEFNQRSGSRVSGRLRGSFRGAATNTSVPLSSRVKIMRTAEHVREKVERHHSKNREAWTTKRYGDLLSKAGTSQKPAPLGLSTDPKARMMSQASAAVSAKRAQRLARVSRAEENMMSNGAMRANRKMNWGLSLG